MTAQHGRTLPDDCAQCRKVFAFLHAHHQDHADAPTAARLAEVCGIGPRMVLVHVAHLVSHRRLADDRRTPVPGATVGRQMPPEDPSEVTPTVWAANADVHGCNTCAAILAVLARESKGTWRGQVTTEHLAAETAKSLGKGRPLDVRTVRLHLRAGHREAGRIGHSLVGWGLVAFETADGEITGKDQYGRPVYVRRPDRFILWPSQARKSGAPRWSPYTAQGAAARLLGKTSWFDPSRPQAGWVVRLVAGLLERDCPEAEIMARLDVVARTSAPLASQYRFARRRLVPLLERKTPWTRPTPETAPPVPAPAPRRPTVTVDVDTRRDCPECRNPIFRGRPHICDEPGLTSTNRKAGTRCDTSAA